MPETPSRERRSVRRLLPWLPAPPPEGLRDVRAFFVVVTVVLCLLYAFVVRSAPGLRGWWLALVTALWAAHVALYWLSPRISQDRRLAVGYFFVQGLLVGAILALAPNPALPLGLTAGLIGEAVGMLAGSAWRVPVVALLAGGAVLGQAHVSGWAEIPTWLAVAVPIVFFVVVYVTLFTRQVEAKARAQGLLAELEKAHRELTDYAGQVEDLTLAAERQRLARELHDTLAQGLVGTILQLEAVQAHLENGHPERASDLLRQAQSRAREALAQSRRAIDDLRGGIAGNGDLATEVKLEVDRFAAATGLPCTFRVDGEVGEWSPAVREHVVRIVAEALGNIACHASAATVAVAIQAAETGLVLALRDDGAGFTPSASLESGHWGLVGMRERARLCGGRLEIESAPGQGCEVRVWLERSRSGS
ncbi:MAG: sensor histidine kinase [Acidobacteria bacterium]|nr:sensor histidine kinase [Acidobacteriota bacterium]